MVVREWDHTLKMRRAYKTLQQLEVRQERWFNGDHHSTWLQPDSQRPGYTAVMAKADTPPRDPFSLLIAELVHNLRSALDLVAYELAAAHTDPLPDDIAESSEFPIFGDEDGGGSGIGSNRFHEVERKTGRPTRRSGLHKMRGMDPAMQTVIESLQPYHRGAAFRDDPLWQIHNLDRINKHRLLHTVVALTDGLMMTPHLMDNVRIGPGAIHVHPACALSNTDKGTEVASLVIGPVDPSREMNVEIGPSLKLAFADRVPDVQGEAVLDTLVRLHDHVVTEILRRLEPGLI